jgi:type VII secretion-associated serine protease mycosin
MRLLRLTATVGAVVLASAAAIPADPAYAGGARSQEWWLESLNVATAQAITEGKGVVVGVVDSGVYPHPDLKGNLLRGADTVNGGDNIGHVDNVGHGTEVASVIAADGRDATGMLGIAPKAKILPIMMTTENKGSGSFVGRGISAAVTLGAKVINVSAATSPAFELATAMKEATAADVVVVAGSGNKGTSATIEYPAVMPGVLAVGSVGPSGKLSKFSVTGTEVGLCAPGEKIETAEPKSGYQQADGTSYSTAIVSGAAALVRAKFPNLTAPEVIHRLEATADDNGPPGKDSQCGYGVLNIVKALTADVPDQGGSAAPGAGATASAPSGTTPTTSAAIPGTTSVAIPATTKKSSSAPLVVGVVVVVLIAGAAVGFLAVRRRSRS